MNAHAREILRLALPSIVSNITVPLLGLADVAIVGHIGNARYIGAIAVGSMIFNIMYWLFGFLRMGTSGITAQACGAGQEGEARAVLRRSMTVALASGLLILLFQWPIRQLCLWLMRPTDDVAQLVIPYFNICVWGAPAMLGLCALTGWSIGMQNTRMPMVVAIGQNLVNIAASAGFVFGLGMQVEGIALGTVVAQWVGFAVFLLFVRKSLPKERDSFVSKGGYAFFFSVNRDIFLRTLCLLSVNFYFTSAGAAQGAMILAVNALLMQLFLLFSYFLDGFAYSGEALAGKYCGAASWQQLQSVVRNLFGWGLLMVVVFTLVYAVGGSTFLRLLTSDAEVVAAAQPFYVWTLLIPVCGVAAFVWDGVFVGITHTHGMLWACFLAALVFFAVWFALKGSWGNHALWLALNLFLLTRGLVQTIVFSRWMRSVSR